MAFVPSKEQQKVIEHRGEPLVVIAGPGTGKTRTLVERMIQILRDDPDSDVVFITFTRASRRDTDRRLRETLGDQLERATGDFPRVSTLHTFAKSLVHKYSKQVGFTAYFSVLVSSKGEDLLVVEEVTRDLGLTVNIQDLRRLIRGFKSTGNSPSSKLLSSEDISKVIERYDNLCRFYNAIDIEGLVVSACDLLECNEVELPDIFLHVDEYQDLNPIDHRFINLIIAEGDRQVVVTGDDDQSIYSGRHAHPQGIIDLVNNKDWDHIIFKECHRLPSHVLRATQDLIKKQQCERCEKEIKVPDDDGQRIKTFQCTNHEVETDLVGSLIMQTKESQNNRLGAPLKFQDFMILCPSRAIVNELAKALTERFGLSVRKKEGKKIPDDLWRLLLILRMVKNDDNIALRQWFDILEIDPNIIERVRREAEQKGVSLFEFSRNCDEIEVRGFTDSIEGLRNAKEDVEKFLAKLEKIPNLKISNHYINFLEKSCKQESIDEQRPVRITHIIANVYEEFGLIDAEQELSDEDKVLVTTLHSSKGLEAEVVFMVRLEDRLVPNKQRDQNEELRVFYVGMTRAAQQLFFSFSERYVPGKGRFGVEAMSPFLDWIKQHLDIDRIMRSSLRN